MPQFRPLALEGVVEILPDKFGDERGFFSETFNQKVFSENGIDVEFVQDNHSFSAEKGVLRGLHFQRPPFAQDKLVRVVSGRVFDVVVDIRSDSPTYRNWISIEISSEKWNQVFIPKGFAHGFLTLDENTQFLYKVSALYSKDHDCTVKFDDPSLDIPWPINKEQLILSEKDTIALPLSEVETGF